MSCRIDFNSANRVQNPNPLIPHEKTGKKSPALFIRGHKVTYPSSQVARPASGYWRFPEITMALSQTARFALLVATFGVLAFILGIVAENKKPAMGTPIPGKGVVICKFPSDPTVALGTVSIISLIITAGFGVYSVFFPYKGQKVPADVLFRSTTLLVFFTIAVGVTVLAEGLMMWATITEGLHRTRNVHHDLDTKCATAKTGLFGGAAFLALDAALFWMICQMLTLNARADYLDEDDPKGDYGQVLATEYDVNGARRPSI